MKSHDYHFAPLALMNWMGSILTPVGLFALAMHLGALWNCLPRPRPILDMDRTIVLHQAEASRSPEDVDLLLLGDSSCVMDVSARKLSAALPSRPRALNLGTLSYLDLGADASLLRECAIAHPNRIRTVVLLMHPEALRRAAPEEYYVNVLHHYYAGEDFCEPSVSLAVCWLGGPIFKGRLLSRVLPIPLDGAYAINYGFNTDLWNYLSEAAGSAIDPRELDRASVHGNSEYRLAARLEAASQAFRAAVPIGAKLFVGITPTPQGFANRDYTRQHAAMLRQWADWLNADAALTNLPPTLPDDLFASTTHLSARGQPVFTELLARSLAGHIPAEGR